MWMVKLMRGEKGGNTMISTTNRISSKSTRREYWEGKEKGGGNGEREKVCA